MNSLQGLATVLGDLVLPRSLVKDTDFLFWGRALSNETRTVVAYVHIATEHMATVLVYCSTPQLVDSATAQTLDIGLPGQQTTRSDPV